MTLEERRYVINDLEKENDELVKGNKRLRFDNRKLNDKNTRLEREVEIRGRIIGILKNQSDENKILIDKLNKQFNLKL